ncbi:MAG: ABC transporter permease [Nanobdellota archaeon]
MSNIITITKKNFKLVTRSKASALIMMLGPVLLMFVIGLALNSSTSTERIDIGYISPNENNLTDEFISVIEVDHYSLKKIEDLEECRQNIAAGKLHICIKFPNDFEISNNKVNQVDFIVDNSKVNLFRSVVDSVENKFNMKAQSLTTGMTQELVSKLNQTTTKINNRSDLIRQLKEENKLMHDKLKDSEKEMNDMDIQFSEDNFDVGELSNLHSIMSDFEDHTQDAMDETEDLIDEIDDFIDESNITSSEEDTLNDLLNESQTNVDDIRYELNQTETQSSEKLGDLINNLQDNVEKLSNRLESARLHKANVLDNIEKLKEQSLLSLSKIVSIEETFNLIISNIQETEVTNVKSIVSPIEKNIKPLANKQSQLNFYFPYLIIMVIMFIGILLASNLVFMEKSSKAYFRNFVTPTKDTSFIIATFLTTMIMITIQLIFVMAVFIFYFNKGVIGNLPVTSVILFLSASLFTFLGILIGNVFNSNESNMLASISISSIMLFISDLVYPLEKMPVHVAEIAKTYNPFYVTSELLRRSVIHNVPLHKLQYELSLLLVILVVLFLLCWVTHKLMKQYFILQFSGYIGRRNMQKSAKEKQDLKVYKNIKSIDQNNAFTTKENKKIKNLLELSKFVKKLKRKEFADYVNQDKNEFAEWVSQRLGDENITADLYKTKRKSKTAKILKKAHKKYSKVNKKLESKRKK